MAVKSAIPAPYQVRGWLSQARNDKLHKIYIVMYNSSGYKNGNIFTPFSKFI